MRSNSGPLLYLLLVVSISLRVLPTYVTHEPFSTDSWPLLKDVRILLENSPIDIRSPKFDGYNNFWPGSIIFSAVGSAIVGINFRDFMRYLFPIFSSLSPVLVYFISKRLINQEDMSGNFAAFMSSFMVGTSVPNLLIGAGIVKESFAGPFYLALILSILIQRSTIFQLMMSFSIVLTHHLTLFNVIIIFTFMDLTLRWVRIKSGRTLEVSGPSSPLIILIILTVFYYAAFAKEGIRGIDFSSVLLNFIPYLLLGLYLSFIASEPGESNARSRVLGKAAPLIAIIIGVLSTWRSPVPGLPKPDLINLLYVLPLVIFATAVPWALRYIGNSSRAILVSWLFSTLSIEAFSVISRCNECSPLAYREISFLIVPMIIISSFTFRYLNRLKKIVALALIFLSLLIAITALSLTLSGGDRITYIWTYSPSEVRIIEVIGYFGPKKVLSDNHISYLATYYSINVDEAELARIFLSKKILKGDILVHRLMKTNGFTSGPVRISGRDVRELVRHLNKYLVVGPNEVRGP